MAKISLAVIAVIVLAVLLAVATPQASALRDPRPTPTPTFWATKYGGERVGPVRVRSLGRVAPAKTPTPSRYFDVPRATATRPPYRVDPNPCPRPDSRLCGIH